MSQYALTTVTASWRHADVIQRQPASIDSAQIDGEYHLEGSARFEGELGSFPVASVGK